jgi:hypothetical protein
MKNFTRKAIYLGIVLCLFGFAACQNIFEPPKQAPLSTDMGRVTVVIGGGESAKTLAPGTDEFTKYTVTFSGPAAHDPVEVTNGSASVELPVGEWTISATGYTGTDPDFTGVAEGSVTVTVTKNAASQANILLKPKTGDDLAVGTFTYSLGSPDISSGSGELVITAPDDTEVETITLEYSWQGISGTITLNPGQYLVRVRLQKGETLDTRYAGFTEALHIYSGMTSAFDREYEDDDFFVAVSESFDLTDLVTAPVRWETPVTGFATQTQYAGTIAWKEADGETAVTGVFAPETVYKAVLTLSTDAASWNGWEQVYTFVGVAENSFSYEGASAVTNAEDSGIVTITFAATAAGSVTSVTVDGGNISLAKGGAKTFTAVVAGNPTPPQTVTWTVTGNSDTGTAIGADTGKLNIALNESATTLTVTAASVADNGVSGPVTVTVTDAPEKEIAQAADLAKIGVEEDYPLGGKYKLTGDLTLSSWTPIGTPEAPFSGVIDGNSKTITVQSFADAALLEKNYLGIFGYVKGASSTSKAGVKDLTITSSINDTSTMTAAGQAVGLFAGYTENTTITGITITGSLTFSTGKTVYAGGIAGIAQGGTTITDCTGGVALDAKGGTGGALVSGLAVFNYVGGFVGIFKDGVNITNCHNTGNVTSYCTDVTGSQVYAGGIAGGSNYAMSTAYHGSIEDCSYSGTVHAKATGSWTYAGGIAGTIVGDGDGTLQNTTRILRCSVTGTVSIEDTGSGWPYVGGIVGYNYYGALVSQSYFNGAVVANSGSDYTGGIAGYNSQASGHNSRIEDCWSSGTVTGFNNAGGIVGQNQVNTYIRRCYSTAAVSTTSTAAGTGTGGIAGLNASALADAVSGCVALNPSITTTTTSNKVHRISATNSNASALSKNLAWSGMAITASAYSADKGADKLDGADIAVQPSQEDYVALGWDFSAVWEMDSYGYPKLKWQAADTSRPPLAAPIPAVAVENYNSYDAEKNDGTYTTGKGGKLTVSWAPVPGATSYDVYYAPRVTEDVPEIPGTAAKSGEIGTSVEITDNVIGENTMNYYVWIKATNPAGTSEASAPASTLDRLMEAWIAKNGMDAYLITNADVYYAALWDYPMYGGEGGSDFNLYIRAVVPFEGGSETVGFNGEIGPAGIIVAEYDRAIDTTPNWSHKQDNYFIALYYYGLGERGRPSGYLAWPADLAGSYGEPDYGADVADVNAAITKFTFADKDKYIAPSVAADYYRETEDGFYELLEMYSEEW